MSKERMVEVFSIWQGIWPQYGILEHNFIRRCCIEKVAANSVQREVL